MSCVALIDEYARLEKESISVDLRYPRTEGRPQYIEVGLDDVRAADSIRIRYDFSRDGWSIEQSAYCDKSMPGVTLGPFDWKEVAFIEAWGREADPARVRKVPDPNDENVVSFEYDPPPEAAHVAPDSYAAADSKATKRLVGFKRVHNAKHQRGLRPDVSMGCKVAEPLPWLDRGRYCLGVDPAVPGTDHVAIGVLNPNGLLKLEIKTVQHLGFTIKKEDFDALLDELGSGGSCACDGTLDNGCPLCSKEQFQRWYGERINSKHAMDSALERGKKVHEELEHKICAGLQVPREYLSAADSKATNTIYDSMLARLQRFVGEPPNVRGEVVVAASTPEYVGKLPPIEETIQRINTSPSEGIATRWTPVNYIGFKTIGGRLMFGCRSEETAKAFAMRDKVLYGLSPLGHAFNPDIHWYTGTAEELRRVGIEKPIDPSTGEPVREITYCLLAGNGKFLGGIVIEGYYAHARDALVQIEKLGLMPECPEGTGLLTIPARSTDEDVSKEDFDAMWSNKNRLLSAADIRSLLDALAKPISEFEAEEQVRS